MIPTCFLVGIVNVGLRSLPSRLVCLACTRTCTALSEQIKIAAFQCNAVVDAKLPNHCTSTDLTVGINCSGSTGQSS